MMGLHADQCVLGRLQGRTPEEWVGGWPSPQGRFLGKCGVSTAEEPHQDSPGNLIWVDRLSPLPFAPPRTAAALQARSCPCQAQWAGQALKKEGCGGHQSRGGAFLWSISLAPQRVEPKVRPQLSIFRGRLYVSPASSPPEPSSGLEICTWHKCTL